MVVAAPGVYVVDAKRHAGEIRVRDVSGLFQRPDRRLFVGRRDCTKLAAGLGWQLDAVPSVLHEQADISITPVLCFVDAD